MQKKCLFESSGTFDQVQLDLAVGGLRVGRGQVVKKGKTIESMHGKRQGGGCKNLVQLPGWKLFAG
jgi:hypothetical protein